MKEAPRGIIVLEGADCSGKTTLANRLREKHGARYIHNRVWPKGTMWKYHLASVRLASKWADSGLVVIDRCWMSELVYGPIYRGAAEYDVAARCLDRLLLKAGAVNILCVPSDQERQLFTHSVRADDGEEAFKDVRRAVAAYADLRHGNVAVPGDGYLGQLTRYGDYAARRDVVVYDIHEMEGNRSREEAFDTALLKRLAEVRNDLLAPALRSDCRSISGPLGATGMRLVIVGGSDAYDREEPFVPGSDESPLMDLTRAVHAAGISEDSIGWVAGYRTAGVVQAAKAIRPAASVALWGTGAFESLHFKDGPQMMYRGPVQVLRIGRRLDSRPSVDELAWRLRAIIA